MLKKRTARKNILQMHRPDDSFLQISERLAPTAITVFILRGTSIIIACHSYPAPEVNMQQTLKKAVGKEEKKKENFF